MGAPVGADRQRVVTAQFVVVTAATLAYFVYVGVLVPLIPTLVERGLGGSKFDIGLTMAAFSISAIACRPLLARLGERWGMRMLMMAGAGVAVLATIGAAYVANRYVLLPLRGLQGVGEAFVFVGGATLVAQSAAPRRRAEAASYYSVGVFVGLGLGPLFADHLVNRGRYRAAFFLGAGFIVLAGVLAAAGPRPVDDPRSVTRTPRRRTGLIHRGAMLPGAALAIGVAAFSPFSAFLPDHARQVGFSGSAPVFALYTVVCLAVRIGGARLPERIGLITAVSASMVGMAAGMGVLALWVTRTGVLVGTALLALGVSMLFPSLSALASNAAADDEQVLMMSTFTMFFEVGVAAGGLVFGAVAAWTDQRGAFAGASVAALIGLVLVRTRVARRMGRSGVAAPYGGGQQPEADEHPAGDPAAHRGQGA